MRPGARLWALVLAVSSFGCSHPGPPGAPGAPGPTALTAAERSGYIETTSAAEVDAFLAAVDAHSEQLHLTTFGTSGEGRALPLMVWGADGASAEAVRASGRTRVLVVANIHGGEVAGKEAALTLLRDLAENRVVGLNDLTVLVAPLYNADGNEAVAFDNRPLQLGPTGGMGQRPNAAGLDLNRDLMKAAAAETRALLALFDAYDPHVVLDLHTTDGTAMDYGLTYAPGLSPNTPTALDTYARDILLPDVSASLLDRYDLPTYHYGNVPGAFGEAATAPRGWYSFSPDPRFLTNYVGLRGRLGILSEAYSYSTFKERVVDTRRFVDAVLARVAADAVKIRALTDTADGAVRPGDQLALRADFDALPEPVEIWLSRVDTVAHPMTGAPMRRDTGDRIRETMPAFVRFAPTETERVPSAYFVRDTADGRVAAVLDAHGIAHASVPPPSTSQDFFAVDSLRVSERAFQNVRMQTVFGQWSPIGTQISRQTPATTMLRVEPIGPMARVVFMLLEPRSPDGLVAWGVLRDGEIDIRRVP